MSNNGSKRFKKDASGNSSSTLTREERIKKRENIKGENQMPVSQK